MARFDLHAGLGEGKGYVVNVRADLLVPLLPRDSVKVIRDLNPIVRIDDMDYVVLTQELAAVPRSSLRRTIGSRAEWRDEITRALDVLFIGF